ncbi:MAG: M1 family aminopeptidase [Acidimicrobiia bacterium]|nr:M1 family aminopeptidase [Acidimicrobiia bacterium]
MSDDIRLPRDVQPRHYRLILEPDLDEHRFVGHVTIDAEVLEATDRIVVNATELEIDWAVVTAGATTHRNPGIELDEDAERLVLSLPERLEKGSAVIEISFRGSLNDQLRGFYRSTYTDEHGTDHTIATTQFQSTDARRAFPCWDEPDRKAAFAVTLVVDPDHLAISNSTEVGRESLADGRVAVHFADTIPMSTYLVAFVVGPLDVTDPVTAGGTQIRIVHRPGRAHLTPFALEVAAAALDYYVDYYDLPYPGDKLDMVAIPDFAFGAMENLGCVTYREVLLLVDPAEATQSELQRVADVINHELAHMWFGDLVTMRWWNGIWLNEAFATFMETKATDAFRPDWDRWTDFGLSRSMAFDVDSLRATRPIEYPVRGPADAEGMFDILTYEKGAAVVRMLEQHLGEDDFRDGVRQYLRTHALGNTDTDDLWRAIEQSTGQPIEAIMRGWIFQGGYPLLRYERTDDSVRVTQSRFGYGETLDGTWLVPVGAATGDGITRTVLDDAIELPISGALPRLNVDGSGFYRVGLDDEAITAAATGGALSLPAVERYALVDDGWALVLRSEIGIDRYLALVSGFVHDDELAVWQRITASLSAVHHVCPESRRTDLERWIGQLLAGPVHRWGSHAVDGETDRQRQLRALLRATVGTIGAEAEMLEWARGVHRDGTDDPELATAAVSVIAGAGEPDDFDEFWLRYRRADDPQTERRYLDALADFDAEPLVDALWQHAVSDDVRSQDAPYLLGRALTNRIHGPMVWQRLADQWTDVIDRFPSNSIARMLGGIRALSHDGVHQRVAAFIADHPVPQGEKMIEQHLERLEVNVALRARCDGELAAALG